jgi:hypothetical protein
MHEATSFENLDTLELDKSLMRGKGDYRTWTAIKADIAGVLTPWCVASRNT